MPKIQKFISHPLGEPNWINSTSNRHCFFQRHDKELQQIHYSGCFGFRGNSLPMNGWGGEAAKLAFDSGYGLYWHPSFKAFFGIGKKGELSDEQKLMADTAGQFKERFGLLYLLIHPDALQYGEPDEDAGLERYLCRHSAQEFLDYHYNEITAMKEINSRCGGILAVEPVHDVLFSEKTKGFNFTYYAAQLGFMDIIDIAAKVPCFTAVDSEHLFGADELHRRKGVYAGLPKPKDKMTEVQWQWAKIAGYRVDVGYAPTATEPFCLQFFIELAMTKIFHLGGSTSLMTRDGLVDSHLGLDLRVKRQKEDLGMQIKFVEANGGIFEVECCGWVPGFSSRPKNDWQYKCQNTLKVIKMIRRLQTTGYI